MKISSWCLLFSLVVGEGVSFAGGSASHSDPVAPILLGLVILLMGAKIGGFLAHKFGQPVVLGELVAGVLIGNMTLFGFAGFTFINEVEIFSILASIGVVLLLFEVGLESSVNELLKVGGTAR